MLCSIVLYTTETVDFVTETQSIYPVRVEEDPACFVSQRTGRGPLNATWLDDVWRSHQKRYANKGSTFPQNGEAIPVLKNYSDLT